MGCKESKHIATDNTIITRSSSVKSTNRGQDDSCKNNVQRSRSGRSTMQKQEGFKETNVGASKANNVINENEKSGYDKGTVNVNGELDKEGGKLKGINHQNVKGDKDSKKDNDNVGDEAVINDKEDQNGNEGDNRGKESILNPKEDLPFASREDGETIVAVDNVSGASVYCTPTEVASAFDNTKTESAEEKKEPVEKNKDTKAEETAKENLTRIVNANPENHVREAEVDEKIKEAETAVATPENHLREAEVVEKIKEAEAAVANPDNHLREAEVEEKIKAAEAAVASLEYLVKEADKAEEILVTEAEPSAATIQNPVKEAEEVHVKEVEATNSTLQTLEKEADKSDKTGDTLIKEGGEAVENGVKEIHEVTGKAEEIPVKEVETSHETNQENQVLVADKAEEAPEKEAEAGYTTPVNELESLTEVQSQDAAKKEEDTGRSSTAIVKQ